MPVRDSSHLTDILQAARLIGEFTQDTDQDRFLNDRMRQSAVMHQLAIIGEATKRVSEGLRSAHPEIPWRQMAGMRDILVHAYDHVDPREVWQTAVTAVPELIQDLLPLVSSTSDPR